MSKEAARKCYEKSGLRPSDIDVIELHDCFSSNELITYEALGLCPEGNIFDEMQINLLRFIEKISLSLLKQNNSLIAFPSVLALPHCAK